MMNVPQLHHPNANPTPEFGMFTQTPEFTN